MYKLNLMEIENKTTYGVSIVNGDDIIKSVPNLSPNKERVEQLIREMNSGNMSTLHFDDIIEDFTA